MVPVLEQLELFRVVNVDRPHHPGLVLDFTSNYERGARPRRIERVFAIVHMGDLHLHDDRGRVSWTSGSTVMTHGIFTSTGNVVAWFDTEDEALAALGNLVAEEPEAADEIAAIPFDDEGHACGPAIKGSTMCRQARTGLNRPTGASLRRGHGLISDPREQRLASEQRPPADFEKWDAATSGQFVHRRTRDSQQLGHL